MDERGARNETGSRLADSLAAERTFLAWIRTGLALMGFGFVVARFGVFLHEIQPAAHTRSAHNVGLSLWLGTALIALGVLVNRLSGVGAAADQAEGLPFRHREFACSGRR